MNKQKLVVALLLDESGSMTGNKELALNAVNEYIQTLKNEYKTSPEKGKIYLSFITFNSGYGKNHENVKMIYNLSDITEVEIVPKSAYNPSGGTPLLEAITKTIESLDEVESKNPFTGTALTAFMGDDSTETKIVMVVQTDGEETQWGTKYTKDKVAELIKDRESKGNWTFVFLGAGIDAISEGMNMGIKANSSYAFEGTARGVGSYGSTYSAAASLTGSIRNSSAMSVNNVSEILKTYAEKHNAKEELVVSKSDFKAKLKK